MILRAVPLPIRRGTLNPNPNPSCTGSNPWSDGHSCIPQALAIDGILFPGRLAGPAGHNGYGPTALSRQLQQGQLRDRGRLHRQAGAVGFPRANRRCHSRSF